MNNIFKEIYAKIYRFCYKRWGKYQVDGVEDIPDEIKIGLFRLGRIGYEPAYKPKFKEKIIPAVSVKNQNPNNTCIHFSSTANKETYEKTILSARGATIFAWLRKMVSGNGFSNLWGGAKVKLEDGIPEERLLPTINAKWEIFCDPKLITPEIKANAAKHKTQSVWSVDNLGQYLQLADEGESVCCTIKWYDGYNNLKGGVEDCILKVGDGVFIGGHAINGRGYLRAVYLPDGNIDMHNSLVAVLNSFSKDWGDNGWFYVRFEDAHILWDTYGALAEKDMPKNLAKFINENEGRYVKSPDLPEVYKIENGKKRKLEDDVTLMSHGITPADIVVDSEGCLNDLPDGDLITFWDAPLDRIKGFKEFVRSVLADNNEKIKEQLRNKFKELF